MSEMVFQTLSIKQLRPSGPNAVEVVLAAPQLAEAARPGQFVMLRPPDVLDPLLPRPMSVYRVVEFNGNRHPSVLFNVVGAGTSRLAAMAAGQTLSVLGPLGTGFRLDPPPPRACLVAGGIGSAGLGLLAQELSRLQVPTQLLYGARSENDLVGLQDFEALGLDLRVVTEDGSRGRKGLVTEELVEVLETEGSAETRLFVCGPTPMLRAVRQLLERFGADGQLALEAHMACGFGICLGCVVRPAHGEGFKLVCKDGPVFDWQEVLP